MMKRTTLMMTAAVGILAVGCSDRMEDVLPFIEEANTELEAAYVEGDAGRLAALFTEDAVVMPNGAPSIPGRQAVATLFERILSVNTVARYQLVVEELEVYRNTAYERGVYDYLAISASQDTTAEQGRYIMLRKKSANGAWLIHRWLENTSPQQNHPFM